MSSALFGNAARASSKNLVEFKAGKMSLKSKMVHADTRKGMVYVYQSDDGLMHFCWKDRTSGSVEEDLIIFPDDCEYRAIPQCTDGRAFVLKFKSTARRLFFWMQETSTAKDEEYVRKINDLLNNPPALGSQSSGRGIGASSAQALLSGDLRDSDLHSLIGNISQQQLLQILGSGVPSMMGGSGGSTTTTGGSRSTTTTSSSTTAASTTASTTSASTTATATPAAPSTTTTSSTASAKTPSSTPRAPIQLSDLQNILSGMGSTGATPAPEVDLSLGLTSEALQPLLSDPAFVAALAPHLPAADPPLPPAQQLQGTVASPQFQQAVGLFSHALGTGQLGPLVAQFGLGDAAVAAANSADMEAFVKALESKRASDKDGKDKDTKKDNKDDDEQMSVD